MLFREPRLNPLYGRLDQREAALERRFGVAVRIRNGPPRLCGPSAQQADLGTSRRRSRPDTIQVPGFHRENEVTALQWGLEPTTRQVVIEQYSAACRRARGIGIGWQTSTRLEAAGNSAVSALLGVCSGIGAATDVALTDKNQPFDARVFDAPYFERSPQPCGPMADQRFISKPLPASFAPLHAPSGALGRDAVLWVPGGARRIIYCWRLGSLRKTLFVHNLTR
jgi:hypothetical protein